MFILGLTGSVGMGKTTATRVFRQFGVAVYDADASVHQLIGPKGKAVALIQKAFPEAVKNNHVNRSVLGSIVYNDQSSLTCLESILHPLVQDMQLQFLQRCATSRNNLVVLDVPLLFENKIDKICDAVAVVTAPEYIQKTRVLNRPGMSTKRFNQIRKNQFSDLQKRRRADFIIQTGLGRNHSLLCVCKVIGKVKNLRGNCWPKQRVGKHA